MPSTQSIFRNGRRLVLLGSESSPVDHCVLPMKNNKMRHFTIGASWPRPSEVELRIRFGRRRRGQRQRWSTGRGSPQRRRHRRVVQRRRRLAIELPVRRPAQSRQLGSRFLVADARSSSVLPPRRSRHGELSTDQSTKVKLSVFQPFMVHGPISLISSHSFVLSYFSSMPRLATLYR